MKTFNTFFSEFNKNYSYEELFLKNTYSEKSITTFKRIFIPSAIFFLIGDLLIIFKSCGNWGNWIVITSCLPTIIYVFIIQTYFARKELKSKKLPIPENTPSNWFKWISPKLQDKRMEIVLKEYDKNKVENNVIKNLIQIANQERNEPIKNPFLFFEKMFEYLGKTFLGVLIGLLIASLNRNYSIEGFNSTMRLILGLLLIFMLFSFVWKFMFKRVYFENIVSRNKKLKEFAFILENIILVRLQQNKKT